VKDLASLAGSHTDGDVGGWAPRAWYGAVMVATGSVDEQTTEKLPWDASRGVDAAERPFCVGRFMVLDVVGAGGMGLVYAAYDPELDRKIAVKVVRAAAFAGLRSSVGQSQLIGEAQAMARLSHPNVVTVHDVGTVGDGVFIAMEFVDGVTLRTWLHGQAGEQAGRAWGGAPRWQETLDLFIRAGRGLAAAHEAGVIHRDFKPDNVLVGRDGRVKVVDFGLAQAQGGQFGVTGATAAAPEGAAGDTQVDAVIGTPAYMAPEQHDGAACDARADQFSFCVALWEGLYGARPFAGVSPIDVALAMRAWAIEPVPRDSRVPRWLHRVLLRGLARDPAHRYPSMRALLAELGRDRGRLQRLWLVAAVAAVMGLAASLAWSERASEGAVDREAVETLHRIEQALLDPEGAESCACPGEPPEFERPVPADR
jgi:serine/threonine protein kinase